MCKLGFVFIYLSAGMILMSDLWKTVFRNPLNTTRKETNEEISRVWLVVNCTTYYLSNNNLYIKEKHNKKEQHNLYTLYYTSDIVE